MRWTRGSIARLTIATIAAAVSAVGCSTVIDPLSGAPDKKAIRQQARIESIWADQVCSIADRVDLAKSRYNLINEFAEMDELNSRALAEAHLSNYVVDVSSGPSGSGAIAGAGLGSLSELGEIGELGKAIGNLRPIGDAASDKAVSEMQRAYTQMFTTAQLIFENSSATDDIFLQAAEADRLIEGLPDFEKTLVPVAKRDPSLARALNKSGECNGDSPNESGKLPQANDRTDLSACRDGACEVEVSRYADIEFGDNILVVGVADNAVYLLAAFPDGSTLARLGSGSDLTASASGRDAVVETPTVTGDNAIVRLSRVPA